MSEVITTAGLRKLVDEWLGQGKRVAGPLRPKPDLCLYAPLNDSGQLVLDGFIHPANSIKEFFFPRHEAICVYRFKGHTVELEDHDPPAQQQVILAARPCDAASLPILDKVFNWDSKDKFYNARRDATTIVSLACTEFDGNCFCTTVNLSPASERGSDVLLLPLGSDQFEVRCLTDKGKSLFEGKTTKSDAAAKPIQGPEKKIDVAWLQSDLKKQYENPAWKEISLRCLGCGACAYNCPTCHCFDIVDEGDATGGLRVKNWDSCQFGQFTMHASGHNPRANQAQRQRQRIQHKFRIYPEKFNEILCTGCGNCTRNCPVELGVLTALLELRAVAVGNTSEVG